jgi:hypothetical protein
MTKLIYSSTDTERHKILKGLYEHVPLPEDEESVFTEELISRIERYYQIFEKMRVYEEFLKQQRDKQDKEFNDLFNKATIFVKHYYLSMLMAIERGELPATISNYYGFNYPFDVPNPKDGDELLKISESLFNADAMRVGSGGKYFANPSIGAVKVWVEKFHEAWEQKTNKFNVRKAEVENIENIRRDADNLIFELHALLDKQFEVIDYDEQILLFASYGMTTEPGSMNGDYSITESDSKNDSDNRTNGNTSSNQLKFDLFFPEM